MKLLEDQLKDTFWSEEALTKALTFVIKNATSIDLIEVLLFHLEKTNKQV